MRFRMTPRDTGFFELFATLASHLVTGADLLAQVFGADPADRAPLQEKLSEMEHVADETAHAIMRRLNQTFVTPFDRDDIYVLAANLDDCMDHMEAAGEMTVLYGVEALPAGVNDQVATLQRSAELTADAMPRLRTMDGLEAYWIEINRLENAGDKVYRKILALLFSGEYKALEVLKLKDIVSSLEGAIDAFESVAHTVEQIAVKES